VTPVVLAEIHAACFTVPRPWTATEFAALLATDGTFTIAESQGFLLARAIADEAEILTLAVMPAARQQGIAFRLLAGFKTVAVERGVNTAFLEVAADNEPALTLYAKAGFTPTAARKAYYARPGGKAVDAVILSLVLA